MNADSIRHLFDQNAIIIIFAWGLVCKYVPQLKQIPNQTIPYVGAIGYVLAKLATGTAFAQCLDCPPDSVIAAVTSAPDTVAAVVAAVPEAIHRGGILGLATFGGWQAIVASLIYERFGRPLLDKLGIKKAV